MIKEFTHGEDTTELWAAIGPWLVDQRVHDYLGMAITAQPGDLWHLVVSRGAARGFALSRPLKNNKLHIRFVYGLTPAIKRSLIKHIIRWATDQGHLDVHTNDREGSEVWTEFGFEPSQARKPGGFCRWEKPLKALSTT